jgi:hypothetical protein
MPNVVLLTKHEKSRWISPQLAALNYTVRESSAFDTDTLGTFSGEVERTLSPKAAALTKAQKACEVSGSDWGLGSEGSFGGGPIPGLINWNDEILCLYQQSTEFTVYASASGASSLHKFALDDHALVKKRLFEFPGQHWILRSGQRIEKGLTSSQLLDSLQASRTSLDLLQVEPDLRALYCPQRQQIIAKAATDLARRLSINCPQCDAVNFVVKEKLSGLPCSQCGLPSDVAKSWISICDGCDYRDGHVVREQHADPKYCHFCNP